MNGETKTETVFVEGMYFDRPSQKAPDFIKGKIDINVDKLIPFLQAHKNDKGYVNIDLKVAKSGKLYLALNTFKPKKADEQNETEITPDDIPFN